ncbi:MAG: preprotein translocase subunit SecE [Candidatus Poribacteria bacterium]|jgi:hypothetical protein|nr:preprotein translocase subunit SecE [Candidatus Poribacteria bacterium]MDP6746377.1 preprotein translocase subunit SecE [Candidatus Poribacteria bacterium]MDP6995198.1 preprotein translocase subunit SecE [Candidatus Poribacteria bacterium]
MIAKTKQYIQDIRVEWTRVSKPEWKDVQGNSFVVIVATLILATFLWLTDGADKLPHWTGKSKELTDLITPPFTFLALLPLVIPFLVSRFMEEWKFSIIIGLIPVTAATILHLTAGGPVTGFGIAWLRSLFL